MKKHWYVLIAGVVVAVFVGLAGVFNVPIPDKLSSSLNGIVITIIAVGLVIPYIEAAIDTAGKHIADSVSKFQPDIEKGFSRLVDTIQKFELGSELRDLRKCLSYPVKYLKHSRTFHLTPEGHGDITGEYEIKNISDRKISKIILPIFGFGVKNYDKTTSYDELHELSIDGKKIDVPIDAIRKI